MREQFLNVCLHKTKKKIKPDSREKERKDSLTMGRLRISISFAIRWIAIQINTTLKVVETETEVTIIMLYILAQVR
jgi:hypothetical protein